VGLIQRVIEAAGIPTVGISVNRPYTEKVKPPRSIFLKWPFGHPLGEPERIDQQTAVLNKAFEVLRTIESPGEIIDVNWPWRRKMSRNNRGAAKIMDFRPLYPDRQRPFAFETIENLPHPKMRCGKNHNLRKAGGR